MITMWKPFAKIMPPANTRVMVRYSSTSMPCVINTGFRPEDLAKEGFIEWYSVDDADAEIRKLQATKVLALKVVLYALSDVKSKSTSLMTDKEASYLLDPDMLELYKAVQDEM